ncbi:Protein MPST-1 [Aphelenchoides avenae]|nr:Protein MPST-1 [Aphelenchus avenae]
MSLRRLVDAKTLHSALKSATPGVRVIDCAYTVGPKPDHNEFKTNYYGKFEELVQRPSSHKSAYLKAHIPSAVHVDLDVAMYPGKYERFSRYDAESFERYAQLIGLNRTDHFVFYGRGPFGGMLFAARVYWLFKSYGHDRLSLLNGGLAAWQRCGFETEELPDYPKPGNFVASDYRPANVCFEELALPGNDGRALLDDPSQANILDTRIRAQFEGEQETGLSAYHVTGTHIPGTKNVPAAELIDENGLLEDNDEIRRRLESVGFDESKPTVTLCNTGMQASLVSFALESLSPPISSRLYCGSLKEMELRDPKRICGGKKHIEA